MMQYDEYDDQIDVQGSLYFCRKERVNLIDKYTNHGYPFSEH